MFIKLDIHQRRVGDVAVSKLARRKIDRKHVRISIFAKTLGVRIVPRAFKDLHHAAHYVVAYVGSRQNFAASVKHAHQIALLDAELLSELLAGGLTLILLLELREGLGDLVQRTDLVEGKAYDTSLLSQSLEDRLTDPPYCVGDELESAGLVEFLGGFDQPQVALVDEVRQA